MVKPRIGDVVRLTVEAKTALRTNPITRLVAEQEIFIILDEQELTTPHPDIDGEDTTYNLLQIVSEDMPLVSWIQAEDVIPILKHSNYELRNKD
jgi:hypothetical protein